MPYLCRLSCLAPEAATLNRKTPGCLLKGRAATCIVQRAEKQSHLQIGLWNLLFVFQRGKYDAMTTGIIDLRVRKCYAITPREVSVPINIRELFFFFSFLIRRPLFAGPLEKYFSFC